MINKDGIVKVRCKYHSPMPGCGTFINKCDGVFRQNSRNFLCAAFEVGWTTWFLNREHLIIIKEEEWKTINQKNNIR